MSRLVVSALLALAAAAPSLAAAEPKTILPGYWESRNRVSFPVNEQSTSRQCVTAQKVAEFLAGPTTRHYACTYTKSSAEGGQVSAQGDCVDKNGLHSTISVKGDYTPTTFNLDARIIVNLGGLGVPISASTQATRIADVCPVEAQR